MRSAAGKGTKIKRTITFPNFVFKKTKKRLRESRRTAIFAR